MEKPLEHHRPNQILLAYKSNSSGTSDPFTSLLPVGLGYLQAMLRTHGYRSRIANLSQFGWKEIEDILVHLRPHILGISQFTHNRFESQKLARLAKKICPGTFVVFGGPHATHQFREILDACPAVDAVVLGEGEETFLDLVKHLHEGKQQLFQVQGIAFRSAEGIIATPARLPINDLDAIPFPAVHMADSIGVDLPRQLEFLITSRGCPAACRFCSSPLFWNKSLRFRSPRNIVEEIRFIRDRFGLIYFSIRDDTFTTDKGRVLEFCRLLLQEKIFILWNCQSRVNAVDEEMLVAMKRAGCECIQFGVESGSPRVLKSLGKGTDPEQVKKAAALVRMAGINLSIYLITGVTAEDATDTDATIRLIETIKAHDGQVSPLAYYPGTELFNNAVQGGTVARESFVADRHAALFVRSDGFVGESTKKLLETVTRVGKGARYSEKDFARQKQRLGYCHATNIMAGEMYEERERWQLAEREYQEITEQSPENPWGWLLLGAFYGRVGQVDRSCQAYKRLIRLVPRHAPAYSDLGELMILAGRKAEAEKIFTKARELEANDATVGEVKFRKNQK